MPSRLTDTVAIPASLSFTAAALSMRVPLVVMPQANPPDRTHSAIAKKSGIPTLADDSGLEIDYLGKEPGIYSSRYMGEDTPYSVKNAELLRRMEGVPDEERTARFVCAICLVRPDGSTETVRETMEGRVAYEIAGENGFGYDPIFYLPERGCTSAELPPEEKNLISHRGKALRKMRDILAKEAKRRS